MIASIRWFTATLRRTPGGAHAQVYSIYISSIDSRYYTDIFNALIIAPDHRRHERLGLGDATPMIGPHRLGQQHAPRLQGREPAELIGEMIQDGRLMKARQMETIGNGPMSAARHDIAAGQQQGVEEPLGGAGQDVGVEALVERAIQAVPQSELGAPPSGLRKREQHMA